jgi:hypothetical protein
MPCLMSQTWYHDFSIKPGDTAFEESYTAYGGSAPGAMLWYTCAFRTISGPCPATPVSSQEYLVVSRSDCEWLPVGGWLWVSVRVGVAAGWVDGMGRGWLLHCLGGAGGRTVLLPCNHSTAGGNVTGC